MGDIDSLGTRRQLIKMGPRPVLNLYEAWQDEAGIDTTIWETALGGTGSFARSIAEPPYLKVILAGAAAVDSARLYGLHRWFCNCDSGMANYLKESILRTLHMEFEARFVNVNLFNNTQFFMGLGSIQNAIETTNNIIGFILDGSDDLRFISADGVGSTSVGAILTAAQLASWHKFKIETLPGVVNAYVDGALVGTITANLAEAAMYPVFNLIQENAAGAPALHIGIVRIWQEDILR